MSLVGTALTGLACVIYKHRSSISVPAVAGTALVSSMFSVLATMGASNILGVTAGVSDSLLKPWFGISSAQLQADQLGPSVPVVLCVVAVQLT